MGTNYKNIDEEVISQLKKIDEQENRNLEGSYLRGRKNVWKTFFQFLYKAKLPWLLIILALVAGFASSKIGVKFVQYQTKFFQGELDADTIKTAMLILAGSVIIGILANMLNGFATNKISNNIRISLWKKVVRLPMSVYQVISPRELISRITQDADLMGSTFVIVLITVLTSTYSTYLYFEQLFENNKVLAYVQLAIIPFFIVFKIIAGRLNYNIAVRSRHRFASLTRYIVSILVNIPLIKSYNKEEYEKARGNVAIKEYTRLQFKSEAFGMGFTIIDQVFQVISNVICILYGGYMVMEGTLDIGLWLEFFMFSSAIYVTLQILTDLWPSIKSMQGSIQRIEDIVKLDDEVDNGKESFENGDIVFENVSFGYEDKSVLNNINIVLKKNKFNAIVGTSGSGKTTILSLLLRFYDVKSGRILCGEKNISDISLNEWRKHIVYLEQNTTLFNMTIRDNLLYGNFEAKTDEEIMQVLDKVGLTNLVNKFDNGLDQVIAEGATSLSGGEKQRFAIARVLLQNPDIILLDEATANLDLLSEKLVSSSIEEFFKDKTIIAVAHRLDSIKNADNVIDLNIENHIE